MHPALRWFALSACLVKIVLETNTATGQEFWVAGTMQLDRPILLLIENDEADVFMFRRALAKLNFTGTVRVVSSTAEARRYLSNCGEFADRDYYPCPDIIVSDMNLLGYSGNDLLLWIREQEGVKNTPFVFISGSFVQPERDRAMAIGVNGFYRKSGDIKETVENVREILAMLDNSGEQPAIAS
jgi:CheY-like chemotaxis protein